MLYRTKMVEAIQDALHMSLTPGNIASAWNATHLWPFDVNPPYSQKQEDDLRLNLVKAKYKVIKEEEMTEVYPKIHVSSMVGLVNTPERIEELKKLDGKELQPSRVTVIKSTHTSTKLVDLVFTVGDSNDELGDYVIYSEEEDSPNVIYGYSKSDAYFIDDTST